MTNDTPYYFRVQASGGETSAYSAEAGTVPVASRPHAPASLSIQAGNMQLSLTWQAVSGATSYQIYRRTEGSAWPSVPVGTPSGTLFNDTGLANGTRYYYAVAAIKAGDSGAWSYEAYGTPSTDAAATPINVAVTPGNYQATVTWNPLSGASQYYVTVAASPGGPATNSSDYVMGTIFTATGLTNGQTYYFRVQAIGNQWSAFSEEVSAVPNPTANIGNITGRVAVDIAGYSDLGVNNATVTLQGTTYSATTDNNGKFILPNIPYGNYTMVIAAPNMDTQTQAISLITSGLSVTTPQMVVSMPSGPKGDANGDDRLGLEDAVYLLQILTEQR